MFEGQPKGLYALALANTGERFGYYTMLAIFTLFLQAKFGFSSGEASTIYASFLAAVYFMPLIGGLLADRFGYGKMVRTGFVVMFIGYLLLSIPSDTTRAKIMMFAALSLVSIGTGLFKGNLQVMVGNLYDNKQYSAKRDTAFSIFYMAINVGAMFAPTAATKVTDWMLAKYGLTYNAQIPELAHQYLNGTITAANSTVLETLKSAQHAVGSTADFCTGYISHLSQAYNYGFGVACISLIVSMAIYYGFRKSFKGVERNQKQLDAAKAENKVEEVSGQQEEVKEESEVITPAQSRQRVIALLLVFAVVIFFWMAFHQNGLTLTFFARDYTQSSVTGLNRIGFDVVNLTIIAIFIYAIFAVFQSAKRASKLIAGIIALACVIALGVKYFVFTPEKVDILPQMFQQFNPFFVVALTPFSLAIFATLANKGKEPSAPRKIGMGMLVAACGFSIMAIGSMGLPTPNALSADNTLQTLVSPDWLISTYLVLTFAELLLSPMGISFVSKVAPPKLKGLMMGGWFVATAVGNYLVSIIGILWGGLQLWQLWSILICLCLVSAIFIFSIMKHLEKVCK